MENPPLTRSVKNISSSDTVHDLRNLIKAENPSTFGYVDAKDLTLWRVSIPLSDDDDDELPISLHALNDKKKLRPVTCLSRLFPDEPAKETLHVIVQRPPPAQDLDDNIALEITLKGKGATTLTWDANPNTATVNELTSAILDKRPAWDDGPRTLIIEDSIDVECITSDCQLRTRMKRQILGGIKNSVMSLEVPRKPFSDITTSDAFRMYGIEAPPPVSDLASIPLTSTEHIQALDDLYATLTAAIKSMPPQDGAGVPTYISAFLMHAVALFPDLKLTMDKEISGRRGFGSVHYTVESKSDSSCILAVTRAQAGDISTGIAQNMVQLDTISSERKRKFDDDTDNDSTPVISYGITTDAKRWQFVQCRIDTLDKSGCNEPVFRSFKVPGSFNFFADSWREDAKNLFGQILWFLRQRIGETSNEHKRAKTKASK